MGFLNCSISVRQHKLASKSELFGLNCKEVVDTNAVVDVRFLSQCEAAVRVVMLMLTSLPPFML